MPRKRSHSYLILPFLISFGIIIFWLMWGVIIWTPSHFPPNTPGEVGDSYGVLTSLVTALSLVAIWFSLHYQRKDTNTQLEMLVQQLEEATDSKKALEQQATETARASKIAALQSKLVFFSQHHTGEEFNRDHISNALYEHSLDIEIMRLLSAIDDLIRYRGKRVFYLSMESHDVCKIWCEGIPYPKIEITPVKIRNHDVLFLIELPPEYECELFLVSNIEPGELLQDGLATSKINLNKKTYLMGEGELYFNVIMEWGMYPHSKEYPITIQTAWNFERKYYIRDRTIIDKPES